MTVDEARPLLCPSDLADEADMPDVRPISTGSLLGSNLLGGPLAWLAQGGLFLFALTLWKALWNHPAGLFTYHPALNSLAVAAFAEGVLLLQPTKTAAAKQKGLRLHQVFQCTALPLILAGTSAIICNKLIHSAAHFQTFHGKFGIITLSLILAQIIFGAFVVYAPLTSLFGGPIAAKRLWKFHRITGYLTLALLFITPLLAVDSDWIAGNTSKGERQAMVVGLTAAAVGITGRISLSKLGF